MDRQEAVAIARQAQKRVMERELEETAQVWVERMLPSGADYQMAQGEQDGWHVVWGPRNGDHVPLPPTKTKTGALLALMLSLVEDNQRGPGMLAYEYRQMTDAYAKLLAERDERLHTLAELVRQNEDKVAQLNEQNKQLWDEKQCLGDVLAAHVGHDAALALEQKVEDATQDGRWVCPTCKGYITHPKRCPICDEWRPENHDETTECIWTCECGAVAHHRVCWYCGRDWALLRDEPAPEKATGLDDGPPLENHPLTGTHGFGRNAAGNRDHPHAKAWEVMSPEGTAWRCKNLAAWCVRNEPMLAEYVRKGGHLPIHERASHGLADVARGYSKSWYGWTAKVLA